MVLNSPTARTVLASFTKLFMVIKVTSDLLTNLYQLTVWLIHSMPRVQREMHLRERETSWRREALRLAKLFAWQGVNTSGEQRCACQDSDAVKKTELRDCRGLLSERRPIRQQHRLAVLHHRRIDAIESLVISRAVVENEPRPQANIHVVNRLNGSDELFPRHIFSSALQPLHQYHRVHKT